MKTVINSAELSLEESLSKTPELLMRELEQGNPNIQVLATIPTPKENLFGFQYQKTTDEELYTKLHQNQQRILQISEKTKNEFDIVPFAILPKTLVEQSVVKTQGLYMWENLKSDGSFTVPKEPVGNYMRRLYETKQLYLEIIQHDTLGRWLDAKYQRNYHSYSNMQWYLDRYKELKNELQGKMHTRAMYEFDNTELRRLFLFSFIPETSFVEEVVSTISSPRSTILGWLDFSKTNTKEIKKIRREVGGLEEARKITREEVEKQYQRFVSSFLQALFTAKEYSQYRIFSYQERYDGQSVKVRFVDPPVDFFALLQQMKSKGIQPIVIAEHDAVEFNLDEVLTKPLRTFCPIVGYTVGDHLVLLKRYGNFSIEEKFKKSVVESYVEHFLGEEYTN